MFEMIKGAAIFIVSLFFALIITPIMFFIVIKDFMDLAKKD